MPFVKFNGFEKEIVKSIYLEIIDAFVNILEIERTKVKVECLNNFSITNHPLSVEILMFERNNFVCDSLVKALDGILIKNKLVNTHIYIIKLDSRVYYIGGKSIENI